LRISESLQRRDICIEFKNEYVYHTDKGRKDTNIEKQTTLKIHKHGESSWELRLNRPALGAGEGKECHSRAGEMTQSLVLQMGKFGNFL
jgi:hypothetical protein